MTYIDNWGPFLLGSQSTSRSTTMLHTTSPAPCSRLNVIPSIPSSDGASTSELLGFFFSAWSLGPAWELFPSIRNHAGKSCVAFMPQNHRRSAAVVFTSCKDGTSCLDVFSLSIYLVIYLSIITPVPLAEIGSVNTRYNCVANQGPCTLLHYEAS